MPAKKTAKKSAAKPKKVESEAPKKCDCDGKECKCGCECDCVSHNQAPIYVLVAMLVATLVVLVISIGFNISVRDIFRPSTYVYNGMFDKESRSDKKDENGFTILSAGATIDMVRNNKLGLLIVGEENCLGCDAFARRVASLVEGDYGIYRIDFKLDEDSDESRAKAILGTEDTPSLLYVKGGAVYDRIDDVKDMTNLEVFLGKYLLTEEVED